MSKIPVIAVDFDNTLVDWLDDERCVPKKGAATAMQRLKDRGCELVIYTCRIGIAKENGNVERVVSEIERILNEFEIPYDSIHLGTKIIADAYIDDRAVPFKGDWAKTCEETEKMIFVKNR